MTIAGKWSISTDEEHYESLFDTAEEAVEEGRSGETPFWIGQCVAPIPPENIWKAEDWIENVLLQWDYSGDWAEDSVSATGEQLAELESDVRKVMAAWMNRHRLRSTHWIIDPETVRKIE